jgi:plastocyanin domain-containing protein
MKSAWLLLALPLVFAGAACKKSDGAAPSSGGVVKVTADEHGFTPAEVTLAKDSRSTLRFTRTSDDTCATKVVFPELALEKDLPLNTPVDVPVDTKVARTLAFQCGMGMFKSKVVIR